MNKIYLALIIPIFAILAYLVIITLPIWIALGLIAAIGALIKVARTNP